MKVNKIAQCLLGLVIVIFTTPTWAEIRQQISFSYDPDLAVFGDDVRAGDIIIGDTPADIDRALIANLNGPGYSGFGSVGIFGTYGLEASMITSGELRSQVFISADVSGPLGSSPGPAEARFIIDGGMINFVASEQSTLTFTLTLRRDFDVVFQSAFEMTGDPTFGNPTTTFFGADIGATVNASDPAIIDIPFSFQSVDLGIISPGESFRFEYQLDIVATVPDVAEGIFWQFEDPLTLSTPPIMPQDGRININPVPVPGGLALLSPIVFIFAAMRARNKRRYQ